VGEDFQGGPGVRCGLGAELPVIASARDLRDLLGGFDKGGQKAPDFIL
jgi:hypothetical protein